MKFYVIRHGQTDYNKQGIYQGRKDIPLNEVGCKQAEEMTDELLSIVGKDGIDEIIVSPLLRARQTADPIVKKTGNTPTICDGMIERSFGLLEGKKQQPNFTNEMMLDYDKNYKLYDIEPIQELFNRVYKCLDAIIEKYGKIEQELGKEQNIVVVTHGAVTFVIDCYMNGEPETLNYGTLESRVLKNAEIRKYSVCKKGGAQ